MRISLDTNILVYAAAIDAGEKHRRAAHVVARSAEIDCVLTLQSVGEFAHVGVRKRIGEPSEIIAQARDWLEIFNIVAANARDVDRALEFHESGLLSYWDALLVSTAASAGCTLLLSEDMQDGAEHAGVNVRNPFAGPELPEDVAALFE
ncbi:MAG: PIN domain-containing protein [Alphaproteobacteria bacterium]